MHRLPAEMPHFLLEHPAGPLLLLLVVLVTLAHLWLGSRQLSRMRHPRAPACLSASIGRGELARAGAYTRARLLLELSGRLLTAIVTLALTFGGGLAALAGFTAAGLGPVADGLLLAALLALLLFLIELPLAALRTFGVEARFGFNRTSPRLFVTDRLRELTLLLVLGLPLAAAVLALARYAGPWWWLQAWGLWVTFSVLLMLILPTFILPLFHRFTPLADPDLKRRLEELLERCGFASSGMFVMDGSSRSSHGNAFFTGIGRSRRIVLFDTLLDRLSPDELEAVLAHELGHFRLHHLRNRLLLSTLASGAILAGLAWCMKQPALLASLGLPSHSTAAALAGLLLLLPYLTAPWLPLVNGLSRRAEYAADRFASQHARAEHLISALTRLYRDNAAPLMPDPLYAAVFDGHPPAHLRIARLKEASP